MSVLLPIGLVILIAFLVVADLIEGWNVMTTIWDGMVTGLNLFGFWFGKVVGKIMFYATGTAIEKDVR